MKIVVVTPRYALAGVPLAQLRFAECLRDEGHDTTFIVGRVDADLQLPELPGIRVLDLGATSARAMLPALFKMFLFDRPDVVFSAEDHLNVLVLCAALLSASRAKISCSSRVTPFDTYSHKVGSKRWILKQAAIAFSWRADAMTCVSTGMIAEYVEVFGASRHRRVFNIIDSERIRLLSREALTHEWLGNSGPPTIVAAGRLAPWKGYEDLLRAMRMVNDREVVRLVLLGDGPSRNELESLAKELGIEDVVRFEGYVLNPYKYFAAANVFAHSAHVESLGNVLVEAMACGCTVVSADCPTGPREVLDGGRFGYLVRTKNPEALAAGIESALEKPVAPELLEEAVARFGPARILREHFDLLGLNH